MHPDAFPATRGKRWPKYVPQTPAQRLDKAIRDAEKLIGDMERHLATLRAIRNSL